MSTPFLSRVGTMYDRSPVAWVTGFAEEKVGKVATGLLITSFWGGLGWIMWKGAWGLATKHPVWGTIFGLIGLGSAAATIDAATDSGA